MLIVYIVDRATDIYTDVNAPLRVLSVRLSLCDNSQSTVTGSHDETLISLHFNNNQPRRGRHVIRAARGVYGQCYVSSVRPSVEFCLEGRGVEMKHGSQSIVDNS